MESATHGVPTSFEPHLPGGTKATLLIEPRNTRARGLRGHRLRLSVDPRIPLDKGRERRGKTTQPCWCGGARASWSHGLRLLQTPGAPIPDCCTPRHEHEKSSRPLQPPARYTQGTRMAQESVRAQVESHWRAFDALADTQSGANEAIIRALDVFEGEKKAINLFVIFFSPQQMCRRL